MSETVNKENEVTGLSESVITQQAVIAHLTREQQIIRDTALRCGMANLAEGMLPEEDMKQLRKEIAAMPTHVTAAYGS